MSDAREPDRCRCGVYKSAHLEEWLDTEPTQTDDGAGAPPAFFQRPDEAIATPAPSSQTSTTTGGSR